MEKKPYPGSLDAAFHFDKGVDFEKKYFTKERGFVYDK